MIINSHHDCTLTGQYWSRSGKIRRKSVKMWGKFKKNHEIQSNIGLLNGWNCIHWYSELKVIINFDFFQLRYIEASRRYLRNLRAEAKLAKIAKDAKRQI